MRNYYLRGMHEQIIFSTAKFIQGFYADKSIEIQRPFTRQNHHRDASGKGGVGQLQFDKLLRPYFLLMDCREMIARGGYYGERII